MIGTLARTLALLSLLVATAHTADPATAALPRPTVQRVPAPARGVFLVADPSMHDPRFSGSVILLLEHSAKGTHGLIINRPLSASVADAIPALAAHGGGLHKLYYGGPVGLDQVVFLARGADQQNMVPVVDDVSVGSDAAALEDLMTRLAPSALRVVAGYAGWAPGQLASELLRNDWQLVRASADDVFADDPDTLWERLHRAHGLLVRSRGDVAAVLTGIHLP